MSTQPHVSPAPPGLGEFPVPTLAGGRDPRDLYMTIPVVDAATKEPLPDPARAAYLAERIAHWDEVARQTDRWSGWGGAYHRRLEHVYRFLIPKGARILEVGCGRGALLAALDPEVGVGVDFSPEMIERARTTYPHLRFVLGDAHQLPVADEKFDFVLLSDLANDLWDVQAALEQVARVSTPRTRVIINSYSRLWEGSLRAAEFLNLAKPNLNQNWLTPHDLQSLLHLAGFEPIRTWQEVLCPLPIPLLAPLCNRYLVRLWPLRHLALTNFIIARPRPAPAPAASAPKVSVVVAARNEQGNVANIFARVPEIGGGTELIFVEGGSSDDTYGEIERTIRQQPGRNVKLFRQTGKGKGDAVRKGFAEATGDILMILDADLTVPPEDLPRFYEAIRSGQAEFVNGVRLVYPMEKQAMRFFNLLGNKFFSWAFSWLLGQPLKDTLCGTKVLWRRDYERLAANRAYFGDFDPFGDFDLIFGAAKLNLKIVDLPIRYRDRTYGETNIQRWKHGMMLLRMVMFAAGRIKFV